MKIQFRTKISLLILSSLFIVACGNKDSEKMESSEKSSIKEEQPVANGSKQITFTKDQYNLAGIETGEIEMRNLSNIIKLNGVIDVEPESMASVSAPLGGYLKTAGRLPGEEIKKGQELTLKYTLYNPD